MSVLPEFCKAPKQGSIFTDLIFIHDLCDMLRSEVEKETRKSETVFCGEVDDLLSTTILRMIKIDEGCCAFDSENEALRVCNFMCGPCNNQKQYPSIIRGSVAADARWCREQMAVLSREIAQLQSAMGSALVRPMPSTSAACSDTVSQAAADLRWCRAQMEDLREEIKLFQAGMSAAAAAVAAATTTTAAKSSGSTAPQAFFSMFTVS